jgi:mRNA-degrading endonuclease toxin of MazEF toxin-antitoxin module
MTSRTIRVVSTLFAIFAGCGRVPSDSRQSNLRPAAGVIQPNAVEDRAVRVAAGVSYVLEDGEENNRRYPDTFEIPAKDERHNLKAGQIVKLMFRITADGETQTERMWVIVKGREKDGYLGILDNDPACTQKMKSGLEVNFEPRHVISIYEAAGESQETSGPRQNR